jgi:hypothetical protein
MKFACPMCDATGNISQDDLAHPVTRATCQNCGTILMINPDTGRVDAHKSPLKDSPSTETAGSQLTARADRDWTAVAVVAIIVLALISAGIYFAVNLDLF